MTIEQTLRLTVEALEELRDMPSADAWAARWDDAIAAGRAALAQMQSDEPEQVAEQFIAAAIDRAPEPLRRLGEWLSRILDEDQWPTAERLLLGAAAQAAKPSEAPAERLTDEREAIINKMCAAMSPLSQNHHQWSGWPGNWAFANVAMTVIESEVRAQIKEQTK